MDNPNSTTDSGAGAPAGATQRGGARKAPATPPAFNLEAMEALRRLEVLAAELDRRTTTQAEQMLTLLALAGDLLAQVTAAVDVLQSLKAHPLARLIGTRKD